MRAAAIEVPDVSTLAFDGLVKEEGAVKSPAKMLTNFGGPEAGILLLYYALYILS